MIKNKDGKPYLLTSPNPLGKSQEVWKKDEKFILYNFNWKKVLLELNDLIPSFSDPDPLPIVQVAEPVIIEEPVIETPIPEPDKKVKRKLNEENIVIFHCQPASIRYVRDELYDEERPIVEYGEKFTFEGVVIERGDLSTLFWAGIEIPEKSVVFPSKYRTGIKYGEHRWWKISKSKEKSGGYLHETIPSDYQPDFSS